MITRFGLFCTQLGPCAWETTIQWDAHSLTFSAPTPTDGILLALERSGIDPSGEQLHRMVERLVAMRAQLQCTEAELRGLESFVEDVRGQAQRIVDNAGDLYELRKAARNLKDMLAPWPTN